MAASRQKISRPQPGTMTWGDNPMLTLTTKAVGPNLVNRETPSENTRAFLGKGSEERSAEFLKDI